ncbi:MAG: hypothetical protein J7M18_00755 [Candidatus Eremiobacteraeota bacterium]|nr:hypothetical protein [Candidatus Eremiobacteraeota bacterium]
MAPEKIITFTCPYLTAPISLTGKKCSRLCEYCRGQYLEHMYDLNKLDKISFSKYKSVLVSGGYDEQGKIPIFENIPFLKTVKNANLKVILHPGNIDLSRVGELVGLVDVLSLEMGERPPGEDAEYFQALNRIIPTVPHLLLGRWGADLFEELDYIEALGDIENPPARIVFLVLIPKDNMPPPVLGRLKEFFKQAEIFLPETEFYLGCMRPSGTYREKLDRMCIEMGFSRIVNPARSITQDYLKRGIPFRETWECCIL